MKSNSKRTLWITGIAIGALTLLGAKKLQTAKDIAYQLQLKIFSLSNIKLSLKEVKFNVVVGLHNPTNVDFGFTSTSKIFIKKLNIYNDQGQLVASGVSKITDLKIPAGGTIKLPEITVNAPLTAAIQQLFSQSIDNLKYGLEIEAFGHSFTLDYTL